MVKVVTLLNTIYLSQSGSATAEIRFIDLSGKSLHFWRRRLGRGVMGSLSFSAEDLSTIGGIATVSILHSFIPTHWLPFSIVGRAQKWTLSRTLLVSTSFSLLFSEIYYSVIYMNCILVLDN